MEFESSCSWFKRFRKPIGILDTLLGILGLVYISSLTYFNRQRRNGLLNGTLSLPLLASDLNNEIISLDKELLFSVILYAVPSAFTIILGIFILVASKKDSWAWSRGALGINVLMLILSIAIVGIQFVLGIHWIQLVPIGILIGIQLIFILVVIDLYRSTQHQVKLH